MTIKAFVAGWPVSHSKSPQLHGYWLEKYGIDGTYQAVAVEEGKFAEFLKNMTKSGFSGGNITIPHKVVAYENIVALDEAAIAIGAVNTIWTEDGKVHGGNTDAYGFVANLDQFAPNWKDGKTALVVGAGGASRAVVYALKSAGFKKIRIANRTLERAQKLAGDFGSRCSAHPMSELDMLVPDANFVVNTTSLGMLGNEGDGLPDLSTLPKDSVVTDIVYTPLKTPFLVAAEKLGLQTVDGLGMLLHQAVPGFEKWFGQRPEVTAELRQHILGLS